MTPTSYLELISSLKTLLGKKQEEVCIAFVYPLTEHNIDHVVNNSFPNSYSWYCYYNSGCYYLAVYTLLPLWMGGKAVAVHHWY